MFPSIDTVFSPTDAAKSVSHGGLSGPNAAQSAAPGGDVDDAGLREAARQFEQVFIAEMLKQARIGENNSAFSGGHGEEAFRSFLVNGYAEQLSTAETFGLAEHIYAQLKEKADGNAE